MVLIVFALLASLAFSAICKLLLLTAALIAAPLTLLLLLIRNARLAVIAGLVILLVAAPLLLVGIWIDEPPYYNRIGQTFGVIGGTVTISGWLASILSPPLSRSEFEQAMTKQTKAISELTEVLKKNNEILVARLPEPIDEHHANADPTVQPDED